MNERIRELAEQAGITTNLDTDYFEKDMNKWVDYYSEKFAELIVAECAGLVDNILRERKAGGGTMGDEIREHFGIPVSDIEAAESYHSDKGYSVGTPEAQEAFESKRGYKL
jgi:hypothetical protein